MDEDMFGYLKLCLMVIYVQSRRLTRRQRKQIKFLIQKFLNDICRIFYIYKNECHSFQIFQNFHIIHIAIMNVIFLQNFH